MSAAERLIQPEVLKDQAWGASGFQVSSPTISVRLVVSLASRVKMVDWMAEADGEEEDGIPSLLVANPPGNVCPILTWGHYLLGM